MMRFGKIMLAPVLCFGLALLVGCGKKDTSETNQPPNNTSGSGGGPPGGMPGPGGPPGPGMSSQDVLAKLPGGEEFAAGKKVYADQNCARCHKLGETGGKMGGVLRARALRVGAPPGGGPPVGPPGKGGPGRPGMGGPDLTNVGATVTHTKEWLADHIRDAKKHAPTSSMPPFGPEKISDADLGHLVDYLASRKDAPPKDVGGKDGGKKEGGAP